MCTDKELILDMCNYIKSGGTESGLAKKPSKYEFIKRYPYIHNFELYHYLVEGYYSNDVKYCKHCKELIERRNGGNNFGFCSPKCLNEYYHEAIEQDRDLWKEAKFLCCNSRTFYKLSNQIKAENNVVYALSMKYDIPSTEIYKFLKDGIDNENTCPVCGNIMDEGRTYCSAECSNKISSERFKRLSIENAGKSWEDIMGEEKADKRRKALIERQTGKHHSKEWVEHQKEWYKNPENKEKFLKIHQEKCNTPEARQHQSEAMKRKILQKEFTPKYKNIFTYKKNIYQNIALRSKYELIFYLYYTKIKNITPEYESLRILYKGKDNKEHVYITDFVINDTIFEIKPEKFIKKLKYKLPYIEEYAKKNNKKFQIITEKHLKVYINELYHNGIFDDELKTILKPYKTWIKYE